MIAPSQGIHLVFDRSFLPGDSAIMVPHTSDGRVMFAIPWHGHTLVGTTDTAIPRGHAGAGRHGAGDRVHSGNRRAIPGPKRPNAATCSAFSPASGRWCARASRPTPPRFRATTPSVSIIPGCSPSTGGKWTTYRHMAEDCVNQAATLAKLPDRPCHTRTLHVHGFHLHPEKFGALGVYGSDAPAIQDLIRAEPELAEPLHPDLPYMAAEVVWAVRVEMARTVEDVLARRTRALFLNARAAVAMAPRTAAWMARELGWDAGRKTEEIERFMDVADNYLIRAR